MKTNYGCDYADPLTYADPFAKDNSYTRFNLSDSPELKAIADEYYAAVEKANAITDPEKLAERYKAFAEAEAILIDHAIAIPFGLEGGYTAALINPFEGQYAPYGVSTLRYKGEHILTEPLSTDAFEKALKEWNEQRAKLG